jgi:hypothetical protein
VKDLFHYAEIISSVDMSGVDKVLLERQKPVKDLFPNAEILDDVDISGADKLLLDERGLVRVLPADELRKIPDDVMKFWCHHRAVYLVPSVELIAWLKERIGGRKAIEIGGGNGVVGRALGVPITDNRCQEWPDVRAYYAMTKQPTVKYRRDVESLGALGAVAKHKPQVVVACWVTHLYRADEHERAGNMYGVDEDALLDSGIETYIHVGSTTSHDKKRILSRPHEEFRPGFLFGRGKAEDRVIWVWEAKAKR